MSTQLEQDVALAESVGIRVSYGGLVADKPAKDAIHALCNAIREQDAKQEPVCYMQENQPYVYVSETKNEGSGYTIPLYTSLPNALELIGYKITLPDSDKRFLLEDADKETWEALGCKCEPIYIIKPHKTDIK
jgi:hypothetical protein